MNIAIVTVGPRGAGKTFYCKEVARRHPSVKLISRDEILIKMFGRTSLSPYEGGHEAAYGAMMSQVAKLGKDHQGNLLLILDCWNGYPAERRDIISKLRRIGFESIEAWYFITNVELCIKAYIERSKSERYPSPPSSTEAFCRHDYRIYHSLAEDVSREPIDEFDVLEINRARFDRVRFIDGAQLLLPEVPIL
jgi:hypothetical protein